MKFLEVVGETIFKEPAASYSSCFPHSLYIGPQS